MRSRWMLLLTCWACLGLTACASLTARAPDPAPPPPPLADALFGPPAALPAADELFALSPAMQQFVQQRLPRQAGRDHSAQALVDALYTGNRLRLRYEDGPTRTAGQSFDGRSGNCLSLVLMTAAFAKALQLDLDYRLVQRDRDPDDAEAWRRSGSLLLHADHVNVVLATPSAPTSLDRRVTSERQALMIDFLPQAQAANLRSSPVDERTLVAMFYNNRAAETLADGQVGSAYWWARAAVLQAPAWPQAMNTLAVVYLQADRPALAEAALRQVLARQPAHDVAMGNLALALQAQGRLAEAQFWRAQAAWQQGRAAQAQAAMGAAAALAAHGDERARYQGKLAWLRAHSPGL